MRKSLALLLAAAFLMTAPVTAAAPVTHSTTGAAHAHFLQKTTAKRFKRGVRRTRKKIRHFFRRASGKH